MCIGVFSEFIYLMLICIYVVQMEMFKLLMRAEAAEIRTKALEEQVTFVLLLYIYVCM